MSKEIDLKSSTIDKGLELIKDFVDKLITPAIEEAGLLFSDRIRFIRFKQQVKILSLAKHYAEQKNINVKSIPVKILVPLLENASLEENEEMQDKWAKMITNMADSETNLQNQIFPYLLSQISLSEYNGLNEFLRKENSIGKLYEMLKNLEEKQNTAQSHEYKEISAQIENLEKTGFYIDLGEVYEYNNLIRLGLIRQLPPPIWVEEFKTGNYFYLAEEWHSIKAEYEYDGGGYRITPLGTAFIRICEFHQR